MLANLRILLTNDDGIDAPGLAVLKKVAETLSDDVWVVAPSGNQSGAGHRFTLGHELEADQRGEREFGISGTPADCVVVGCTHFAADKPVDVVLSGVNNGQNVGDIIHCSGTAAGAREGALHGAIGIGLSQSIDYENQIPINWDASTHGAADIITKILQNVTPGDTYYNVNFPACAYSEVTDTKFVPHQRFARSAFHHYQSDNAGKFFVTIPEQPTPILPGYDFFELTRNNAITVTPLSLRQSDSSEIERFNNIINT